MWYRTQHSTADYLFLHKIASAIMASVPLIHQLFNSCNKKITAKWVQLGFLHALQCTGNALMAPKMSDVCIPTFCQHHHPDCWKCLVHLSFSPNHALYNFNFCGSFRKHVEGKHFYLDDEVKIHFVSQSLGH